MKQYGKARLVLEVIRRYVEAHTKVKYHELQSIFPKEWSGVKRSANGCFIRKVEAVSQQDDTGYTRHFLKDGDTIYLPDGEIAVSTQWGVGNIQTFINGVNASKAIGIKISAE